MSDRSTETFSERLLAWFDHEGRHDLPWQHPRTPYRVWLAEVMLQQTQVQTVLPYFTRFIQTLPTLNDLANASNDQLMALWAGLGYYARARNLHRAAQQCQRDYGGELPTTFDELLALPGIGRSTAGAIFSQALAKPFAILDGNVKRTLCRYHGIEGWPGERAIEKKLWALSEQHLPNQRLPDYTQAIMDFGATLCTRKQPSCERCPLSSDCVALKQSRTDELPQAKPNKPIPQRHTWMLLIFNNDGQILMQRRPSTGIWANLWSLPEAADHDSAQLFLHRHSHAEFADYEALPSILHTFSHYRLLIEPLYWHGSAAKQQVSDNDDHVWQSSSQLRELGLPAPVKRLLGDYLEK